MGNLSAQKLDIMCQRIVLEGQSGGLTRKWQVLVG